MNKKKKSIKTDEAQSQQGFHEYFIFNCEQIPQLWIFGKYMRNIQKEKICALMHIACTFIRNYFHDLYSNTSTNQP